LLGAGKVKEYGPGQFFGELALVSSDQRQATVVCVGTCVLLSLQRDIVMQLLPGQLEQLIAAHRRRTARMVLQNVPLFEVRDGCG
jgi:CRP-like cAMP-binding protein